MPEPTLLFCIGATKAGTTWLYYYLRAHTDCHMRAVKELHYFDCLEKGADNYFRGTLKQRRERVAKRVAAQPFWRARSLRRDLADIDEWIAVDLLPDSDHQAYLAYLNKGRGQRRLVGDITPCYSTLNRGRFAEMYALAPDVRFVYLLRDPIDRAWSQARMNARTWLATKDSVDSKRLRPRTIRNFDEFLEGGHEGFWERSDYARTLSELRAAVPEERIHVAFYESLFTDESIFALDDFLGIGRKSGDYGKVRYSGHSQDLDPPRLKRAAEHLRDQYAYCEDLFNGLLPDRWRAHMEA